MKPLPNICLVGAQVPFVWGGAEILLESLSLELQKRSYKNDIIRIPFKWHPKDMIIKNCLALRMQDLTESYAAKIDILITFRFPSYVLKHPGKVTWLFHQHREIYDLFNTDFTTFTESDEDHDLRSSIVRIDQKMLSESQKLFSCSQNVSERLEKYCGLQSEVLYHPPRLLGKYKCSDFGNYILSVGRLELNKRVDLIIKSMKSVKKSLKLLVVGDGPQRGNLEKLTRKLELDKRIEFTGWVDDKTLLELYSGSLAVVYVPKDEDYGYVTLEAFASKKPVITTDDSGGVIEFVSDGENGTISKPEPEKLAEKINRMKKNTAKKWGETGFESIKNLSWDHCIEKLTSLD